MALSNRLFNGKWNTDVHPYDIAPGDFIDALNITRGSEFGNSDVVVSNIKGNQRILFALPAGFNKTIGQYSDMVRNRYYYFVWNSNGNNLILYLDRANNIIVKVFENLTDSNNIDILSLNPSYRINHINILYRNDGDILYWTDGLNAPGNINVERAVSGNYGVFRKSYLEVIKTPPNMPIKAVYEDDNSISVNNLRKKLFKFKYRFVYLDNEKSVWSAESEMPLPINFIDTLVDGNPSINSKIEFVFQTGTPLVKNIEIAASQSLGNVFSDYFLISDLKKSELSIPDDDIYIYSFYNNQAYLTVDAKESILAFDWVPLTAFAQEMPNGNVLTYAAYTEGYDLIPLDGAASDVVESARTTQWPYQFVANQYGTKFHIVVIGEIRTGDIFSVITTNDIITYTASAGNTTINVINGLSASALLQGYTIVSSDNNNLYLSKSTEIIQQVKTTPVLTSVTDSYVYDYNSRYAFGIVYFDENGRSNGVITNDNMSTQTNANDLANIPVINLRINSRPPLWAKYFHVVRTKNTSKSKILYWASNVTGKDAEYAYIGIGNLTQFISENPGTTLSYSFAQGDRIRFLKRINTGTIYSDKDYEILSQVTTAPVNGRQQTGDFLKIALPPTSGTFNFGDQFYNYLIEIYTPAQSVANGLDAYYEFGEEYDVLDAGTENRRHQANNQNQSADLLQEAIFTFDKGDDYLRNRTIPLGAVADYTCTQFITIRNYARMGFSLNSVMGSTNGFQFGSSSFSSPSPIIENNQWIIKTGAFPRNFRIKGTFELETDPAHPNLMDVYLEYRNSGTKIQLFPPTNVGFIEHTFIPVDVTFQVPFGEEVFIISHKSTGTGGVQFYPQPFTITEVNTISLLIIDNSFSDFFPSLVNSNGRAWAVDNNAAQTYFPASVRFGQDYQADTATNQINRFYFENQDTYDRSFGDIRKLFIEGRSMYVFQKFEIGIVPVLIQIIRDTANNPFEANSDILLNKITYPYKGKYGIGDMPESFAFGKGPKYFIDPNKGVVCRLSQDGITPLSILYGTNTFFVKNIKNYNNTLNNGIAPSGQPYMGNPTVYGIYDAFLNKYIICMEEINRYSNPNTLIFHQDAHTVPFDEKNNAFEGEYSYHPDIGGCLFNTVITFKNGGLWTHDNNTLCNFYGIQYDAFIKGIFNDQPLEKKSWLSLTQESNVIWDCPEITSQLNSYGTTPQESNLISSDFALLEGQYHASFLRDINSPGGIATGDQLKGNYLIVKFRVQNASSFVFLNIVSVKYIDSPLTNR